MEREPAFVPLPDAAVSRRGGGRPTHHASAEGADAEAGRREDSEVTTAHCDLQREPFTGAAFDVVVSSMTLHHIKDVARFSDGSTRRSSRAVCLLLPI